MTTTKIDTVTADLDAPIRETCGRCLGEGSVSWGMNVKGAIYHADGSYTMVPKVCFECDGVGYHVTTQRKINRREADRARRAKKAEAEAAARLAESERLAAEEAAKVAEALAAYTAEHADVVAAVAALPGEFGESLRESLAATGSLTENQAAAVLRIAAEKAAEPEAAPVVEGRVEVVGKVVGRKEVATDFGTAFKMTVLDDRGFRVYGTVPSALLGIGLDRGDRVSFTATVEASRDDETFGFFKRPTKAARLG